MENRATITVTLFGEDSSFDGRRHFRDTVLSALEQAALGEHIGGGSMVTDEANYDIDFDVKDESRALVLIRDALRTAGAGTSTEISVGGGGRYNVYNDSWTDLGPRPSSAVTHPPGADGLTSLSSGDFLAQLKQITTDARKKYGGPKDPSGA